MIITKVVLTPVSTPLVKPFIMPGTRITHIHSVVLELYTDEGIVGYGDSGDTSTWYRGETQDSMIAMIAKHIAPQFLIGQDPLNIGRHWHMMQSVARWYIDPIAVASVDIALWDIAGKAAGLPIHQLLGSCREAVPAYFSSGRHPTIDAYADEALYWRSQGWTGYKLHPPTSPWR